MLNQYLRTNEYLYKTIIKLILRSIPSYLQCRSKAGLSSGYPYRDVFGVIFALLTAGIISVVI